MSTVMGFWGILRRRTLKQLLLTLMILTKLSRFLFHRIRVPLCAQRDVRGRSGSRTSSELRLQQYLDLKIMVAGVRSHWNNHGSEMKTKSGSSSWQIIKRSLDVRLNPSQSHVIHLKTLNLLFDASDGSSDLSEYFSLNS